MKTVRVNLPSTSALLNTNYNYTDSYQEIYLDKNGTVTSKDIGKAFFTSAPKWSEQLFVLRNKIVAVFGLKTSKKPINRKQQLENFNCEPNEKLGLFTVYSKTENEVILGEDDKHLNFRISLLKENIEGSDIEKKLTISTTVKFHNWFGKLYFIPVKPFHKIIVPKMLKGIIKQIEQHP